MFHQKEDSVLYLHEKNGFIRTCASDIKTFQQQDFQKILHVIHFSSFVKPLEWGFPPEFITQFYPNYAIKQINKTTLSGKAPKIGFAINNQNSDYVFSISRKILKIFNTLKGAEPVMILPGPIIAALKYTANGNVQLLKFDGHIENHLDYCDLLLGSEEIAVQALLNNIPVMIIGLRGFGGLVNDTNVMQFVATEFMGRIGGAMEEEIPVSLIQYYIEKFFTDHLENMQNGQNQLSDKSLATLKATYVDNDNDSNIKSLVHKTGALHKSIISDELIRDIKPVICSHIGFENKETDNAYLIRNLITGKTLLTVEGEAAILGTAFNGINTVGTIIDNFPHITPRKIIDLVRTGWEKKIIHFI